VCGHPLIGSERFWDGHLQSKITEGLGRALTHYSSLNDSPFLTHFGPLWQGAETQAPVWLVQERRDVGRGAPHARKPKGAKRLPRGERRRQTGYVLVCAVFRYALCE
jgi:hypothetical protein